MDAKETGIDGKKTENNTVPVSREATASYSLVGKRLICYSNIDLGAPYCVN